MPSTCNHRRLASFEEVTVPSAFDVDMILDGDEWCPAPSVRLVRHHATRVELENVRDLTRLPTASGAHAVFTLVFYAWHVVEPGSAGYFRTTYMAHVAGICESPTPPAQH